MIEQLGPYRIEKMIGRGGMGTVYAGQHEDDGSRAAIKVLSMVLADDSNFRERFIAEIETLKKLDHPNIVRFFGDGEQDGHLFYVMELIDGQSLRAELQAQHEFTWQEVRQIGIDICRALKHAHDRGVIHRDLKPANLLRAEQGHIKLTDFGIAKLFGASHLTADGSVVGTADYMAPEQAEGRPVSNRTDLYSLGAVMYTLLARRPPFSAGSVAQVVHKLRYSEPPPVRRHAPKVPVEFDRIITELLEKDPANRITNALLLTRRLEAVGPDAAAVEEPTPAEGPMEPPGGQVTKVSPTAVDAPAAAGGQDAFSWNEATVVTSGSSPGEAATETPAPDSGQEVAEPAPNRFTIADDEKREQDTDFVPAQSSLQIIGLVAALLLLGGAATWMAWPVSADQLYAEIQATVAQEGPEPARGAIDRFLARFPDDPRFGEVDGLRRDVDCRWLQSRLALRELRSGGSRLTEYEKQMLQAMRMAEEDPQGAAQLYRQVIEQYGQEEEAPADLRECLDAARHLLSRLGQPLGP